MSEKIFAAIISIMFGIGVAGLWKYHDEYLVMGVLAFLFYLIFWTVTEHK